MKREDGNNADQSEITGECDVTGDAAQSSDSRDRAQEVTKTSSRSSTPVQAPPAKKVRKLSKADQVAKTVREVVSGILDKQKEEQGKLDKIEERRLELEEMMVEREMQFRQEQLEFQKQMFTTLAAILGRQSASNTTGLQHNHSMLGMSMDLPPSDASRTHSSMYHF